MDNNSEEFEEFGDCMDDDHGDLPNWLHAFFIGLIVLTSIIGIIVYIQKHF